MLIALDGEGRGKGSGPQRRGVRPARRAARLRAHPRRYRRPCRARPGSRSRPATRVVARGLHRACAQRDLEPSGPRLPRRVDAVVGGESPRPERRRAARALAPFGRGNPELRLLVPSARSPTCGRWGRASATRGSASRAAPAAPPGSPSGSATRWRGWRSRAGGPVVKLELNEWNGAVEPRVVLERALPIEASRTDQRAAPGGRRGALEADRRRSRRGAGRGAAWSGSTAAAARRWRRRLSLPPAARRRS